MDDADRAQMIHDRAMRRYELNRRVDAGTATWRSSVCACCGEMIETERLRVYPSALYCLDCQTEYERGERR